MVWKLSRNLYIYFLLLFQKHKKVAKTTKVIKKGKYLKIKTLG